MENRFTPTAANFLDCIQGGHLQGDQGGDQQAVAPLTAKIKRPELAIFAEPTLKRTGWLPRTLRFGKANPQKKAAERFLDMASRIR